MNDYERKEILEESMKYAGYTKEKPPKLFSHDVNAVSAEVRAIVTRKFVKEIDLDNSVTGNEKRLAVIIECELIDDLPERIIGKTIKICEHFS